MEAKLKCSNCGAEITNLNLGWGKKEWIWMPLSFLPLLLIIWWMNSWLFRSSTEFAEEIKASLIETRVAENRVDVVGKIKNVGDHTWDSVTVEAEFYNEGGQFVDEASEYLSVSLTPGTEEHFRITLTEPSEQVTQGTPKVILKVTDADENRF